VAAKPKAYAFTAGFVRPAPARKLARQVDNSEVETSWLRPAVAALFQQMMSGMSGAERRIARGHLSAWVLALAASVSHELERRTSSITPGRSPRRASAR
jgi:hypothetical protein